MTVIWQSEPDLAIWQVHDSHMTCQWVVIWLSYTCHITGYDMVSYRWYIPVYTSHMTAPLTKYDWNMTVFVCHMTSGFLPAWGTISYVYVRYRTEHLRVDVVLNIVRTISYVRCYIRHRTYQSTRIRLGCRTFVNIVGVTYDIMTSPFWSPKTQLT